MRILITMHANASWGGLHENVFFAAIALKNRGHLVYVACSGDRITDLLLVEGISVVPLQSGESSDQAAKRISAFGRFDLVYCQPFVAREIGLRVSRLQGVPLVSAFHGYYNDAIETWHSEARFVTTVSPALTSRLQGVDGISSDKISTIRNGVEDGLFSIPLVSLDQKLQLSDGTVDVAVLARLDPDKKPLWDETMSSMHRLSLAFPALQWRVNILGSGGSKDTLSHAFDTFIDSHPNVVVQWMGWITMQEVPRKLSNCVLSFASGRGAAQSLAVGTPTVAAGSQGSYGLQTGQRLDLGLWGNFGGYPVAENAAVAESGNSLVGLFTDSGAYDTAQQRGRDVAAVNLKQSVVDDELANLLDRAVD